MRAKTIMSIVAVATVSAAWAGTRWTAMHPDMGVAMAEANRLAIAEALRRSTCVSKPAQAATCYGGFGTDKNLWQCQADVANYKSSCRSVGRTVKEQLDEATAAVQSATKLYQASQPAEQSASPASAR